MNMTTAYSVVNYHSSQFELHATARRARNRSSRRRTGRDLSRDRDRIPRNRVARRCRRNRCAGSPGRGRALRLHRASRRATAGEAAGPVRAPVAANRDRAGSSDDARLGQDAPGRVSPRRQIHRFCSRPAAEARPREAVQQAFRAERRDRPTRQANGHRVCSASPLRRTGLATIAQDLCRSRARHIDCSRGAPSQWPERGRAPPGAVRHPPRALARSSHRQDLRRPVFWRQPCP